MRSARRSRRRRSRPPRRCCSARTRRFGPNRSPWLLERSADDANAVDRLRDLPGRARPVHRLGHARRRERRSTCSCRARCRPSTTTSRTTTPARGRTRCRRCPHTIEATLDYWDDNLDVYRVYLQKGRRLFARVTPKGGGRVRLASGRRARNASTRSTGERSLLTRSRLRRGAVAARLPGDAHGHLLPRAQVGRPAYDPLAYRLAVARG